MEGIIEQDRQQWGQNNNKRQLWLGEPHGGLQGLWGWVRGAGQNKSEILVDSQEEAERPESHWISDICRFGWEQELGSVSDYCLERRWLRDSRLALAGESLERRS